MSISKKLLTILMRSTRIPARAGVDTTAPEITLLSLGSQTAGDLPVTITITEAATGDWVLSTSATEPTPTQVAAGQMHTGAAAAAAGEVVITATGTYNVDLPAGLAGSYYLHISPIDAANNRAAEVYSAGPVTLDTTAPSLSSATDAADGATASTWGVTTDSSDGTLYWVITTSATSPTKAQVKAGQNHTGATAADSGSAAVASSGAKTGAGADLTASTAYYTHFMHEDAQGNQSNVLSADGFTTTSAVTLAVTTGTYASGYSAAPTITIPTAAAGDEIILIYSCTLTPASALDETLFTSSSLGTWRVFRKTATAGQTSVTITNTGAANYQAYPFLIKGPPSDVRCSAKTQNLTIPNNVASFNTTGIATGGITVGVVFSGSNLPTDTAASHAMVDDGVRQKVIVIEDEPGATSTAMSVTFASGNINCIIATIVADP